MIMALSFQGLCSCFKGVQRKDNDEDDDDGVRMLDFSHGGLVEVPDNIFLYERTLEKLFLESNRVSLPFQIVHIVFFV